MENGDYEGKVKGLGVLKRLLPPQNIAGYTSSAHFHSHSHTIFILNNLHLFFIDTAMGKLFPGTKTPWVGGWVLLLCESYKWASFILINFIKLIRNINGIGHVMKASKFLPNYYSSIATLIPFLYTK